MRTRLALGAGALVLLGFFLGTAIAGNAGSLERDVRTRARVWCEAVVDRDPLRYQDSFRKFYFRGPFNRFKNEYEEPSEDLIRSRMPRAHKCTIARAPRKNRRDVYVPVRLDSREVNLRLRQEAGFWVVWQIVP